MKIIKKYQSSKLSTLDKKLYVPNIIVFPCQMIAHFRNKNDREVWLSKLIFEL